MSLFDYLRNALRSNTDKLRNATGAERRKLLEERGTIKAGLVGDTYGFEDALDAMRETGTRVDMERARELREDFLRTYPGLDGLPAHRRGIECAPRPDLDRHGLADLADRGARRRRERLEDCLDGRTVPGTARRDPELRERVDNVPEDVDPEVLERRRRMARGDFS